MAPRVVAFDNGRATIGLAPLVLGSALVAFALAREAWTPHPAPARPLPAWAFEGPVTLALAWGFGGSMLVVLPLWIVAPMLLPMLALARWRRRPMAALVAAGLLFAGALVPVRDVLVSKISDVAPPPGTPTAGPDGVRLWEVAGHGPYWIRSDLMGAGPVICPTGAILAGVGWLAALVDVAWVRWRKPAPLLRRLERAPADAIP